MKTRAGRHTILTAPQNDKAEGGYLRNPNYRVGGIRGVG
jgi:hypothetical protein